MGRKHDDREHGQTARAGSPAGGLALPEPLAPAPQWLPLGAPATIVTPAHARTVGAKRAGRLLSAGCPA